jgi:type II secretory pathway pseudopilin PulG
MTAGFNTINPKPNGFTLIELLVVASLTVLIMLTVSSLLMAFLITSQKATIEQRVQSEGDSALAKIEFILRNSRKLVPNLDGATTCNNDPDVPMESLAVEGLDGFVTTLQTYPLEEPKIASHSGAINDYYYLTSDETTLSNLEFTCLTGAEGSYYVSVSFDLQVGIGTTSDRETALENFQTGVTLRNN